jgi:hypothetical protein
MNKWNVPFPAAGIAPGVSVTFQVLTGGFRCTLAGPTHEKVMHYDAK